MEGAQHEIKAFEELRIKVPLPSWREVHFNRAKDPKPDAASSSLSR
jgi:hypothetical protein